jgi:hypothetical protein
VLVIAAIVTPADAALVVIADVIWANEGAATAAAISEFWGPTPGILSIAIRKSPLH